LDVNKTWAEQELRTLPMPPDNQRFVAWDWSPDGKRVIGNLSGPPAVVATYSFETKQYEKLAEFGASAMWLPDSTRFVFIFEKKIYLGDIKTSAYAKYFPPVKTISAASTSHPTVKSSITRSTPPKATSGSSIWSDVSTKTSQLRKKCQKAKRLRRRILLMLRALEFRREVESMHNKRVLTVIHVLILVASFAVVARAQDTPYRLNDKEVKKLMAQLKKDTGRFRKSFDSSLDRSRLNGTNGEDDINHFLKNYEDATERL
jgi:hypothetical protein